MRNLRLIALIGLAALSTNCVVDEQLATTTAHAIGPATITVDQATYQYNDNVTVTWAGVVPNATDWVAIAPAGSAPTVVTRWTYTNGMATGSTVLEGPRPGGQFVARVFDSDGYTLEGESDPFTVNDPTTVVATVAPTAASYTMTDPITVTWSGLPGSPKDWISLAPVGFPLNDHADWIYTGGGTSGSLTFVEGLDPTGYPPGMYVVRAYLNDTFTLAGESAPFPIGAGQTTITTDANSYTTFQPIPVSWTNFAGTNNWIAIAPEGSSLQTVTTWVYTNGTSNGTTTFTSGLSTPGSYVARGFLNDSYTLADESPAFVIAPQGAVTVTTNASAYTLGQFLTVTWQNLPGGATDWISYAPAGSSDSTVTRWVYTGGQASGSYLFEGPVSAGTYVARAYVNNLYVKVGESAQFVVQ